MPNNSTQYPTRIPSLVTSALAVIAASIVTWSGALVADYREFEFSEDKPYYFEDGKVDFGTYNRYRRYPSECHVCH